MLSAQLVSFQRQANPDKFQEMVIGQKKSMSKTISINFDSVVIKPVREIKDLGVDIDDLLYFNTPI